VDLQELELRPEAEHMKPGWFESLTYFVSLHPHSEHHDDIPLPDHPPLASVEGEYVVSKSVAPKEAGGLSFSFSPGDSSDTSRKLPVVNFREHLELHLDRLDTHLVAYLWGRKSSLAGDDVTLVGRALAPMQEFEFQRKSITWGVFDVAEGHRVGELRLEYAVCTVPAAVRNPRVAEADRDALVVRWDPPISDSGSALLGYRVSIATPSQELFVKDVSWRCVCELTKTLQCEYTLVDLTGNTTYLVNIQAVNKVGMGDPCSLRATTAPREPDPPLRPRVADSKDGCLNVVWTPPACNGGFPVEMYGIKMRKSVAKRKVKKRCEVVGCSDEKNDTDKVWIDMGTIPASEKEQVEPSMYNAWVGPLEKQACEYRFQIVAYNRVGPSAGSELSDPHYS